MTSDYRTKLYVRVRAEEHLNSICSALRGLLHANGQSDGQTKTNQQFRRGVEIEFGTGPSVEAFLETVDAVIRRKVRARMTLERRP
jgi:hypothetical protein